MRYQEELDGADIKAILNNQKRMENGRATSKSLPYARTFTQFRQCYLIYSSQQFFFEIEINHHILPT